MINLHEERLAERYIVVPPIAGSFGVAEVSIVNVAESGAQIEHAQPLRIATKGRLVFRFDSHPIVVNGVVMWSHLSKTPNQKGKLLYRSGVRLQDDLSGFSTAISSLWHNAALMPDSDSLDRKRQRAIERQQSRADHSMLRPLPGVNIPSDVVMLVQQARERLRANPDEAARWLHRGTLALSTAGKPELGDAFANRDEVIAVWEYLDRSIDLETTVRALAMR